jgi:hypothetical protein
MGCGQDARAQQLTQQQRKQSGKSQKCIRGKMTSANRGASIPSPAFQAQPLLTLRSFIPNGDRYAAPPARACTAHDAGNVA